MNNASPLGLELTPELLNERLEGYRVAREVGHGAMGIVFEALQRGLERRVAVKVLPPSLSMRDRTVRRFLREAEAMGRLSHTNIVDVYEVGSRGSLHYFAMRYVEGPPLDVALKAGVLGVADVIQVGIDVSAALAHAHARGVLHRDVKPSNLLRDGERVVLTDFGLAKPIDASDEDAMTESGDLVGTPLYMSPEQIVADPGTIDARSDVWGLGATLYELLVGRPPFSGGSAQSILHAILQRDPALLRRQRADVPRDLEAIVLKCLEKNPARRYSGAAGLNADLIALQAGRSVSARPPRLIDPALRWSRRHPYQCAAVILALSTLGIFAGQIRKGQENIRSIESSRDEAVVKHDQESQGKMLAIARSEMLAAVAEWGSSEIPSIRLHALDRVGHLMQAIPVEEYPQLSAEILRVYASFARKGGLDESTLTALYPAEDASATRVTLMMRAAMLEGLERFDEALRVHRRRAGMSPRAPEPWLDAANAMRQLALLDRANNRESLARARFGEAISMHNVALDRAVRAGDKNMTATVLIERARCLIEIGERALAERNLRDALAHDRARADALALLEASREEPEVASLPPQPGPSAVTASSPPGTVTAPEIATPTPAPELPGTAQSNKGLLGLPLMSGLPSSLELDRQDLTTAGKNLTSIYRGLRDVLRTAANPGGSEGAESGVGAPLPISDQ